MNYYKFQPEQLYLGKTENVCPTVLNISECTYYAHTNLYESPLNGIEIIDISQVTAQKSGLSLTTTEIQNFILNFVRVKHE